MTAPSASRAPSAAPAPASSAAPAGSPAEGAIARLLAELGDAHVDLAEPPAVAALVAMGDGAVAPLVASLRRSSWVPAALARMKARAAVAPLVAMLGEAGGFERDQVDRGPGHRARVAATALGLIGDPAALPALEGLARSTTLGEVESAAAEAIARITRTGSHAPAKRTSSRDEDLRLAKDAATPPETLADIAESNDWDVVSALLANPAAPPGALRRLNERYTVPGKRLWWQLAQNPSCPPDILEQIVRECDNTYTVDLARKHKSFPGAATAPQPSGAGAASAPRPSSRATAGARSPHQP